MEEVGALNFLGRTEALNCAHHSGHTVFARTLSDGPTQLHGRLGNVVSRRAVLCPAKIQGNVLLRERREDWKLRTISLYTRS